MSSTKDALAQVRAQLAEEQANGKWHPEPSDPLYECEFIRAGFRSWGLEAPDKSWKVILNRLDFGASSPSALLEVYAPGHEAAFGDLNDFVFSHSIGVNGGTNFTSCITRLSENLGGAKLDWSRRVTYLIARAREANAGTSNGTFSTDGIPEAPVNRSQFMFKGRVREGRTLSIFGPGGSGKTTFVDGLVVSVCSGQEIVPDWRPSRRYRTLVLDWDEGREEEEVRLSAICRAYDVRLEAGYHYKRMSRPLVDLADEIGAYVVANKIELVIVSPMDKATEDRGDNLATPVINVYEVLRTFGTTNIIIDHVPGANLKGGAEREIGSTKKRDNARGSYSLYAQGPDDQVGVRSIVLRNKKADALMPTVPPQAVRITYDPPAPIDGIYASITFEPDQVIEQGGYGAPDLTMGPTMRISLHRTLLENGHMTVEELADVTGRNTPSIRTVLNRHRDEWFSRLPSGKWEALPARNGA